jgi:hypothetical protein
LSPGYPERFAAGEMETQTLLLSTTANGDPLPRERNSIGGGAILPRGVAYPTCTCGAKMVLFFQLDIPSFSKLEFAKDCHLSVFMCPVHNECSYHLFPSGALPLEYWLQRESAMRSDGGTYLYPRHYQLVLHSRGDAEQTWPEEMIIRSQSLFGTIVSERIVPDDECCYFPAGTPEDFSRCSARREFKVSGFPAWLNEPPSHFTCCCGGMMRFLCQLPSDYAFPKNPSAPPQPNSFSLDDYCLFLGNQIYIFACDKRCDRHALVAFNDN